MTGTERPSAILLHGFGQTGEVWDRVLSKLPFAAIAPDLRGHGSRSGDHPPDEEHLVADVRSLAAGIDLPALVGYSMGGRLALRAALDEGASLFSSLVLVSCSPGIEDPAERSRRVRSDERLATLLEEGRIDDFEEAWGRSPVWEGGPTEVGEESRRMRAGNDPAGLAASLRCFGQGTLEPVWDRLPGLSLPVLIVTGSRDGTYCRRAERMVDLIPGARGAVVEGAGHALPLEAPRELAAEIASFIPLPRQGGS